MLCLCRRRDSASGAHSGAFFPDRAPPSAILNLVHDLALVGWIIRTCQKEGVLTLWTGCFTSFLRLGPHFLITFPLYENLRRRLGLGYL